jgi:hypothetical protein
MANMCTVNIKINKEKRNKSKPEFNFMVGRSDEMNIVNGVPCNLNILYGDTEILSVAINLRRGKTLVIAITHTTSSETSRTCFIA